MKTKTFYGIEFNVYTDTKIDGDFIHPNEAVYFENDIEITGRLEVKNLKAKKSITVGGSYIVEKWEEVGGFQEVGEYQEVGGFQKVGGSQKVGGFQEVGEYQEVGGFQEVGGDATIKLGMNVGFSVTVKGTLKVGKRLFSGICSWRDISEEEMTITCGKFEGGEIAYGILKETGLNNKKQELLDKADELIKQAQSLKEKAEEL